MKKCFVFDYDGTLAPSCAALPLEMVAKLLKLIKLGITPVVMSGTDNAELSALTEGLRNELSDGEFFYLAGTSGSDIIKISPYKDERIFNRSLTAKQKAHILIALSDALIEHNLECDIGGQILDRGSQITLSCIGRAAPSIEKANWDKDHSKRKAIVETLNEHIGKQFTITIAGTTSIDILDGVWDKGNGVRKVSELLNIPLSEILFFGDKCQEGGNDYPATLVVDHREVNDYYHTLNLIEKELN